MFDGASNILIEVSGKILYLQQVAGKAPDYESQNVSMSAASLQRSNVRDWLYLQTLGMVG